MPNPEFNIFSLPMLMGIIVLLVLAFVTKKLIFNLVRISTLTDYELKYDSIRKILKPLKDNEVPNQKDILNYAKNINTRILLFDLLNKHNCINLFPEAYVSLEKLAESHLSNWLKNSEDFDDTPSEIQLIKNYSIEKHLLIFNFKFKSFEPHYLAKKGFLNGIVVFNTKNENYKLNPVLIKSNFKNDVFKEEEILALLAL